MLRQVLPGGPILCQGKGTCSGQPQLLASQVCLRKSLSFSDPFIREPLLPRLAFYTIFVLKKKEKEKKKK